MLAELLFFFVRRKNAARLDRWVPRGHTEAVKPWKNEVLVMSIASAWFAWCAQGLPGRATPVPGGRAVLCSVVNLWSSGAVLFVPLVLAANKRSGSADRPHGYRTHLLEAGKLLHDLACHLGSNTYAACRDTLIQTSALVMVVPKAKKKVGSFRNWRIHAPTEIP